MGDQPILKTNDSDSEEHYELQQGEKNAVGEILLKDISSFINRGQNQEKSF